MNEPASLPANLAAAHTMILAERHGRLEAERRARHAEALMSGARLVSRGDVAMMIADVRIAVPVVACRRI